MRYSLLYVRAATQRQMCAIMSTYLACLAMHACTRGPLISGRDPEEPPAEKITTAARATVVHAWLSSKVWESRILTVQHCKRAEGQAREQRELHGMECPKVSAPSRWRAALGILALGLEGGWRARERR